MKRKRNGFLCGVRRVATLRREVDEKGLGHRDSSGAPVRINGVLAWRMSELAQLINGGSQ